MPPYYYTKTFLQPVKKEVALVASETPDDVLSMALDLEEAMNAQVADSNLISVPANAIESVSNVLQINQTREETANFNLEIPGFDWQSMLRLAKPPVNISHCNVTLNFGDKN